MSGSEQDMSVADLVLHLVVDLGSRVALSEGDALRVSLQDLLHNVVHLFAVRRLRLRCGNGERDISGNG